MASTLLQTPATTFDKRAGEILAGRLAAVHRATDRMFAAVMVAQCVAAVILATFVSSTPSWPEVWAAVLLGGGLSVVSLWLVWALPGATLTRHVVAVSQIGWSALWIELSGGRAEAQLHVFASLALLAVYRDWRVLLTATAAVAVDDFARGAYWSHPAFGISGSPFWRAAEHVAWVVLEDVFLVIAVRNSLREMADSARQRAQLEESVHALKRQAQDVEAARAGAEAASVAKSHFLATMSHEIRTPMTAILGYADILVERLGEVDDARIARTIKRNGEYLLQIVNDILDLSKIEAGKFSVERVECSPEQIISDVAQLMRVQCAAKNLGLAVEYQGHIPSKIVTDPTRLRQILVNLVGNAVKFTDHGQIRLKVRQARRHDGTPLLRFDIVDQGVGLTGEEVAKLFQPFSQADSTTAVGRSGTGLGLTICKRLAEALGGSIWVRSRAGTGSKFSFTISTQPDAGQVPPGSPDSQRPSGRSVRLECRVLLAEDSPDNQELIAFVLRKAGAEVMLADQGQAAIDLALAAAATGQPFDVILMDMQMPVVDGYDASRRLREQGYEGAIIALTAHAMPDELQRCLACGCDAYLTKPIDNRLIELVARYSQHPPAGRQLESCTQ